MIVSSTSRRELSAKLPFIDAALRIVTLVIALAREAESSQNIVCWINSPYRRFDPWLLLGYRHRAFLTLEDNITHGPHVLYHFSPVRIIFRPKWINLSLYNRRVGLVLV